MKTIDANQGELTAILTDIKSGALPLNEVPGFLFYMLSKSFWPLFAVIIINAAILLAVLTH